MMLGKIKTLWIKYEEILAYLVVGGMTTVVSFAAKFITNAVFFDNTMFPTPFENLVLSTVNWASGVAFAYPTNRIFVFKSKKPIAKEAFEFVLARIITWPMDTVVMQILTAMEVQLVAATVISAVLVVVTNYVFSKLFVFKKKKKDSA